MRKARIATAATARAEDAGDAVTPGHERAVFSGSDVMGVAGRFYNPRLMQTVLYFHGFASSPGSAKITALRPLLAPYGIELNAPDLNAPSFERLDFDAMVARGLDEARRTPPRALAGSSLGALVALAVAREVALPLVLIAPALGIADRWKTRIPGGDPIVVFNYARNADAPIHRAFFEQMAALHVDEQPPRTRVTAIMGREDETVPFDVVETRWREWEAAGLAPGSRFIELSQGDHSLVAHAEIIRDAIVEAAR